MSDLKIFTPWENSSFPRLAWKGLIEVRTDTSIERNLVTPIRTSTEVALLLSLSSPQRIDSVRQPIEAVINPLSLSVQVGCIALL
jgi:hypothetical protein